MMVLTLLALLLVASCSLPKLGGGVTLPEAPQKDLTETALEALPEVADAASNLLQTFVITAVIVALMFPAARVAAVGVFVAFYDRIAQIFKSRDKGPDDRNGQA